MHSPKWQICAAPAVVTAPKIEYRCTNIGAYFDPVPRAQRNRHSGMFPLPASLPLLEPASSHHRISNESSSVGGGGDGGDRVEEAVATISHNYVTATATATCLACSATGFWPICQRR
eukprot:scaffold139876_cov86-Cyclotella_meneghiniana.AAC.1